MLPNSLQLLMDYIIKNNLQIPAQFILTMLIGFVASCIYLSYLWIINNGKI